MNGNSQASHFAPAGRQKRTLTPANVFAVLSNFVAACPVLLPALLRPKTSAALRERVMLGVTSINDCRYCSWGHTHWAMAHGVSLEEVNQILGLQAESVAAKSPADAAAILFAQHYAEHRDQFDPEAIENLRRYYDAAQVAEILAYVRAVTLGSLVGNTVDAFFDRFRGDGRRSDGDTNVCFEGAVTVLASPLWLALTLLARWDRHVGVETKRTRE